MTDAPVEHRAGAGNRLGNETSPYLLQHQDNPVHWWAWGPEALAEAKRTGKPILLSVGYAACHWCHVMAHESFEDDETAAVMNDLFVNIKVDREERPDVDTIYMSALHELGEPISLGNHSFLVMESRAVRQWTTVDERRRALAAMTFPALGQRIESKAVEDDRADRHR